MHGTIPGTVPATTKNYILVTHDNPDTDAYACLWAAKRFVVKDDSFRIVFMADERLSAEEVGDAEVLYMDTGGGPLDQHGKELTRSSSFELVCEHYQLKGDPGLDAILEMTRRADNDEAILGTDIHHLLGGLRRYYTDPTTKEVKWEIVCDAAFMVLDIIYNQTISRFKQSEEFKKLGDKMRTLENGLKIAVLHNRAGLKEAAREAGADVVIFTSTVKDDPYKRFTVGIQAGRDVDINLAPVIACLRAAEARRRQIADTDWLAHDLAAFGENKIFGGWFFHESRRLIVCGTPKHPLSDAEYTKLNSGELRSIVLYALEYTRYQRRQ